MNKFFIYSSLILFAIMIGSSIFSRRSSSLRLKKNVDKRQENVLPPVLPVKLDIDNRREEVVKNNTTPFDKEMARNLFSSLRNKN